MENFLNINSRNHNVFSYMQYSRNIDFFFKVGRYYLQMLRENISETILLHAGPYVLTAN